MFCVLAIPMSSAADASPSQGVIYGTVQTAPGVPVPGTFSLPSPVQGARVVARNAQTGKEFDTKTNARGRYTLTVPAGSYVVRAAHGTQAATVESGQKRLVNFVIPTP